MTTESLTRRTSSDLQWGDEGLRLHFRWDDDSPVVLDAVAVSDRSPLRLYGVPVVELTTATQGHLPASARVAHTELGASLRYVDHTETFDGDLRTLALRQRHGDVEATLRLEMRAGIAAIRAEVTIANLGAATIVLRSVASWSSGFTASDRSGDALGPWQRVSGVNDWLGEGRFRIAPLRGPDFVSLAEHLTGHNPRGSLTATSDGTWSTGHHLPTAALISEADSLAIAWQIEHNGAWRWEIGEDTDGGYFALSGPTSSDSGWARRLAPAASFTSVPVTVAYGTRLGSAVAALTDHRRATRRPHPDSVAMPVVFNDYMNTLDGDPTTEKLLPLIDAAASVGAEIFCIDAGWYDDSGHWWDSVGEWRPSQTRFPGGLGEVIDRIRESGMVPGLWLEPEVVGVRSSLADALPPEAFLQVHGQRIVEHHRYHLDLRHPAAREHLDSVVDRLVAEFGIGFIKMDYNINPGPGTDLDADSVGDGLLEHNRAHLAWLDGVLDRHPTLVVESCSSGAMRMDYAMLSRVAMQSTSDQQDFRKYPPIAASAPLSILPEQAASWAYPQPGMTPEEASFCLVTGLLGRFYVSGHLNEMEAPQRARVADAILVAKSLRTELAGSHPYWPSGLPDWNDDWVSLGLRAGHHDLVSVWRRGEPQSVQLQFPHLRGVDVDVATVFPHDLPAWRTRWDAAAGILHVHANDARIDARTLRLTARRTGVA